MTECRSLELQDLLPDFAAGSLDDLTTARVASHVATCSACADDLAVLQLVRQARPRIRVPDVARIVAALPSAPTAAGIGEVPSPHAGLRLVDERPPRAGVARPAVSPGARSRSVLWGQPVWRLAATLGVVIAGGASMLVARRGITGVEVTGRGAVAIGESAGATLPPAAETVAVVSGAGSAGTVSVSYGDLGDYSEDELQRMLDRLDQWDGATNTEPLPGVPILPGSDGGTP